MEPDEIIQSQWEAFDLEAQAKAARDALAEAQKSLENAQVPDAAYIALPAFVLGVVGGAVGAKMIKGTLGAVFGAGAVWWAYTQLAEGPKQLAPGQTPGVATLAPPPKKNLEGCAL